MKNIVFSAVVLSTFFIMLSEKITATTIACAMIVAVIVTMLNKDRLSHFNYIELKVLHKWMHFIMVLFKEVVISNIQVAIIVLSKDMKLAPEIVRFESKLSSEVMRTVLANSITLTPGTMTVDISDKELWVHCLNGDYKDGLTELVLEDILHKIEGDLHG
ncbi:MULTISPECIES: Na+/H+ antiporter subunit E [unclassified Fusibacter]|uniref:Na+/H+ antiporter subunit E n=1 Tax=unclassified Fusibacter TaxID=2624464 RepID=UPI0013E98E9C|nr:MULTISPECIES: Na+/H+ antiporter subunit E [unclassified Fusibacter]MCK8061086.1 Na+/H+ antiporter subunit E [Fusibacter sp. A2]NPE23378.1 Na+/H+ antiporter subunit E [Fusibacter sp. A1]